MSVGKISFLGLAGAGKTSICNKIFYNEPLEKVLKTLPTELFKLSKTAFEVLDREFQLVIFDLGGQQSYISSHLVNDAIFIGTSALIFVIDVSDSELFENAIWFLSKGLEKARALNENSPLVAIFLHKYDPLLKDSLKPLAEQAIVMIQAKVPDLHNNIYRPSILDESTDTAMNDVLTKAFKELGHE